MSGAVLARTDSPTPDDIADAALCGFQTDSRFHAGGEDFSRRRIGFRFEAGPCGAAGSTAAHLN